MAFIETVPVDRAAGDVRAMYEQTQASLGYVPNYAKVFSHRPGTMDAWAGLLESIRADLDDRHYELITLSAARALRSSYCMLAHGTILRERFYPLQRLGEIANDPTSAGLEPAEVAMMDFAEQVVHDAAAITESDIQVLREHGFTDAQIFDVAAAAAARCFFSKLLDALGAEPDAAYSQLEEDLRERLIIGRPIDRAAVERVPASNANSR
jgi:uncharacterized peroxidase-related enzyme